MESPRKRRQGNLDQFTTLVFSLLLVIQIHSVNSEFRFCYKGPQRFTINDCPGGILFKKALPTQCTFFLKTKDVGDVRVAVNGDVCDSSIAEDADVNEASPTHTFSIGSIQEISFDVGDIETGGVDPASQTECLATCFPNWVDIGELPSVGDGGTEDPENSREQVYQFPAPTQEVQWEQENITEELLSDLIMEEPSEGGGGGGEDGGGGEVFVPKDLRVIDLLRSSFEVMTAHCFSSYIPESVARRSVQAMIFLLGRINATVKDVGSREYEQLKAILAQCKFYDPWNTFRIIGKECELQPTIVGANYTLRDGEEKTYIYNAAEFPFNKFDTFIEASWSAVAFVHGNCFPEFTPEFNMQHVYMSAMEALFDIKQVLERWVVAPSDIGEKSFWNNILETYDYKTVRLNINACAKIAYAFNPYKAMLERPFKQINGSWADISPVAGPGPQGWTGTEVDYWSQYNFKNVLAALGGTCYSSDSDRDSDVSTLTHNCVNSS